MGNSKRESKKDVKTKKKSTKRKREEVVEDSEHGGVSLVEGHDAASAETTAPSGPDLKKRKKTKKTKTLKVHDPARAETPVATAPAGPDLKKRKKSKELKTSKVEGHELQTPDGQNAPSTISKSTSQGVGGPEDDVGVSITDADGDETVGNGVHLPPANTSDASEDQEAAPANPNGKASKNHRFIVFVGNLPYNATAQTIQAHFSAVNPTSIRHRTHKEDPSRSKGFAFLEFDGYERMATCLQKFHHSRFDDGSGKPRRINVELTAGGGGKKSETRNEKVKAKNAKLNDERKRRAQKEAAEAQSGEGGPTVPAADGADANGEDARGGVEAGNAKAQRRSHEKPHSKSSAKVKAKGKKSSERAKENHKQGQVQPDGRTDVNIHPSRRNRFHA